MTTAIVVDSSWTVALVQRLLQDEVARGEVELHRGGPNGAAISAAQTINHLRRAPVVLVLDADTSNPKLARDRELDIRFLLSHAGGPLPCELLLARPELEAVFFDPAASGIVERIVGLDLTLEHRIRAEYEPKRVLLTLLGDRDPIWFIDQLTDDDVARLRETAIARQLLAAIAEVSGIPA